MKRAEVDPYTALFGEGPGGVLVSGSREELMQLSAQAAGVGFLALGTVGGRTIRITAGAATIASSVEDARRIFQAGLADRCRD
jgi:hypothetical protein